MKRKGIQCKHLDEALIIAVIRGASETQVRKRGPFANTVSLTTICGVLVEFPPKLVLAKLHKMCRRQILDGCACGCRGDFVVLPVPALKN